MRIILCSTKRQLALDNVSNNIDIVELGQKIKK